MDRASSAKARRATSATGEGRGVLWARGAVRRAGWTASIEESMPEVIELFPQKRIRKFFFLRRELLFVATQGKALI